MDRRPNVIVTGFMGTGKTTVGRLVASRLGLEFVDTDDLIEQEHGPIPSLFRQRGEAGFRQLEREVAARLAEQQGLVIATGGGMMLDEATAARLAATGTVVCLTAAVEAIIDRTLTPGAPPRPLLAGADPRARVDELLLARARGYSRFAQVDTTDRTPDEVADAVVALVS